MKRAIWRSYLDAQMNVKYWKYLAQRYAGYDQSLKIFLAVVSSGAVAGWSIWGEYPAIWKILSGLSAIVAIALPIMNLQKKIQNMSILSGKWFELSIEYEEQWRKLKSGIDFKKAEKLHASSKKKETILVLKETDLPDDKKLLYKCFNEVKNSHGI